MTTNVTTQSYSLFLGEHTGVSALNWLGNQVSSGAFTYPQGEHTLIHQFDARGGVKPAGSLKGIPAAPTTSLAFRVSRLETVRKKLMNKRWVLDKRLHPDDGTNRDSPTAFTNIERMTGVYMTSRTTPAAEYTAEADAVVDVPLTGEEVYDIERVGYHSTTLPTLPQRILRVSVGKYDKSDSTKSELYAITYSATESAPILLRNKFGGDPTKWTTRIVTEAPNAFTLDLIAFGNFVGILMSDRFLWSSDYGEHFATVTNSEWSGGTPPMSIFGEDQRLMFIGTEAGTVWRSVDGGKSWTESPGTNAGVEIIGGGVFEHNTVYMYHEVGIDFSTDRGITWKALPLAGGSPAIISATMLSDDTIVILDNAGYVWESTDTGENITQHSPIPGVPVGTGFERGKIIYHDAVVGMYLLSSATHSYLCRNIAGMNNGDFLFIENGTPAQITDTLLQDIVYIDQNTVIGVGSNVANDNNVIANIQ